MNQTYTTNPSFHGLSDREIYFEPYRGGTTITVATKRTVIQNRTLSYRFYPHFHPYVSQLVQRLLEKSTSGLQAADTEYEPDGVSLPGSIEVDLDSKTSLSIPGGSRIALLNDLTVTLPGGDSILLSADMKLKVTLKVTNAVEANLPDGMGATLLEGMTDTPPPNTKRGLSKDMAAIVARGTKITLPAATQITLYNGKQATIVGGSAQVLLLSGTQLTIPQGREVTLISSQPRPVLFDEIFFPTCYKPSGLVSHPYPVKDLDFTSRGAYSVYNWELFFHVPLTIGIHLSKNQRFQEAQRWFHYIFDPTDDSDGPTPERFWKVKPFQHTDVKKIEEILVNLATGANKELRDDTISSIGAWKNAPFRPHVIARYRQSAYMFKTVMAYLDNLIAWGDTLFRQDTGESINEAMIVYVLAANILGPRPQEVPEKGSVRPQTYANLRSDLDKFGNVMRGMEADIGLDLAPFPSNGAGNERLATIRSLGKALYFCVPRNDKLLSYWDTVADRLFKIRNSLNLQGIFRQLPLFEPPIDPALLARAAAAGLDIGAVVSGANQPLPLVRFQLLAQKATEICQEVKSLGNNLLSAMEKEDGEALTILRSKHERIILGLAETVKYSQLQESIKAREGLEKSLATAIHRYIYYERQLGKPANEIVVPQLDGFDSEGIAKLKFSAQEPELTLPDIPVDIVQDLGNEGEGKKISSYERQELVGLENARKLQDEAAIMDMIAKFLSIIPEFGAQAEPMGVGAAIKFGGQALSTQLSLAAEGARTNADKITYEANKTAKIGSYARREQDWAFQSNLAAAEINQVFKQLRAAEIRQAIAELELKNHRQQMVHAEEVEHFLNEEGIEKNGKKTNKALYTWMKREVKGLYAQCFQFAFDVAKKAERALQHELGNPGLSFLQFGYLAGKEGLLAGEKLLLDIKRMEMAYHDLNQREYELTKHASLLQVNPLALLQLRANGRCTVSLPEELFDMDGPGHYFRRIKSAAVSIPCVTGPYTSVNCTLTLLKSSIRKSQLLRDGSYTREGAEDDRFSDHFGSLQSIVTSTGQNDSGMFETNLRDERYLPFEGSGVVSEWQFELPADIRQFDYDTIADVVLHLRYTAREGGGLLRNGAVANLKTRIEEAQAAGSVRLFSMHHEFPNAFYQLLHPDSEDTPQTAEFELSKQHFPYFLADKELALTESRPVRVYLRPKGTEAVTTTGLTLTINAVNTDGWSNFGNNVKEGTVLLTGDPIKKWTINAGVDGLDPKELDDILILLQYSASA